MTPHAGPVVQAAVDVMSVTEAREWMLRAHDAGADWIELGRPLLDGIGFAGIADLVAELPEATFVLDAMVIAAPERYLRRAAELGIRHLTVTGLAPQYTVLKAIELSGEHGVEVTVDLFNCPRPDSLGAFYAGAGAARLMVHIGVDQRESDPGLDALGLVTALADATDVPISYACYSAAEAMAARRAGASVLVVGEFARQLPVAALARFIDEIHA